MAITNVQQATGTSAASSTSVSATLGVGATAGNLIWFAAGLDKSAGTITAPAGFTALLSHNSTSISTYIGYKVAAGGETTITVSRSSSSVSGDTAWVGEFADSAGGTWSVISTATHATDESTVTSWSSGTAADPARTCAAIAFFAIDSGSSGSGSQSFSNSFTQLNGWANSGLGDMAVGWLSSTAGGSTKESTHTHTSTADQVSGAIATFAKLGVSGDVSDTITATTTAAGEVGGAVQDTTTATTTATGSYGASGIVSDTTTAATTLAYSYGASGIVSDTITATTVVSGAVAAPAFPLSPLPIAVELYLNSAWTDVTAYTYGRDASPVQVTRGRTSEGGSIERATCSLTFDNRDGRFSPRNPTGPYYGQLGRNTPLRVTVEEGGPYLDVPGASGDYVSTPDSAALSITGDIDLRVDLYANDWTGSGDLLGKYNVAGPQRGYAFTLLDGQLRLTWSADNSTVLDEYSTAFVPMSGPGRLAVRVTLDVDNGAGGYTVRFYTASTIDGPWRELGRTQSFTPTTSIFDNSTSLNVGDVGPTGTFQTPLAGRYYAAQVRSGIDGTIVANPVFSDQITGASSFIDSAANTWTLAGTTSLSNLHRRFTGEVPEWPQKWDLTGSDAWTSVQAAGILRRLGQGAAPVQSTLRRALSTGAVAGVVAYWPLEDGKYADLAGSGLVDGYPMTVSGVPEFEANTAFACSDAIPSMKTGVLDGRVKPYTGTGAAQVRMLINVPSTGATNNAIVCRFWTTGTAARWDLKYQTGGALEASAYDSSGTQLFTQNAAFNIDGLKHRLQFDLTQSGSNIVWGVASGEPGASTGGGMGNTLNSRTVGIVTRVQINPGGLLGDTGIGHLSVQSAVANLFDLADQLNAYRYETAGRRMSRLCSENGITFVPIGDLDDTVKLGYQRVKTLVDLLKEAADADGGVLFEPRDLLGFAYRTRTSLYRQNPILELSYPGHQMNALEPVEDDRSTRNDVEVKRADGASGRATLTTGALSTASPPNGVGTYNSSTTLSLAADQQAADHANWMMHLGTVDEARYPTLGLNMASRWFTGDPQLVQTVLAMDVGDRLIVTDPPMWVPPDDISQLAQGYRETLGQFIHAITWNLAPESPYRVAIYDDATSRYTSDGSTLNGAHNSSTTSLSVATASGPLWTHADGDFDIVIGGERMTVTNVTGSSSPQTFTVTRSVNGVVKAQTDTSKVELFSPYYYAL